MHEHEVPTHIGAEDKVLLGLTFPQIVAGAAIIGLAYGLWQYAAFLPGGTVRLATAVLLGVLGLVCVAVRPGGRALPIIALDLLRFALAPKRSEGSLLDLLAAKAPAPETRARSRSGPRRWRGFRLTGLPFRCLSVVLAATVLLASVAPSAALAAAPGQAAGEAQRLFIEGWQVTGGSASVTVRAATSLIVQVSAENFSGQQTYHAQTVLYQGEQREFAVPLVDGHRAIVISWRDALGNAGIRLLDQRNFPLATPPLEGADCAVYVAEVRWQQGAAVTGQIASACRSEATEVVDATVLTNPADLTQTVRHRLLIDTLVQQVAGSLVLAFSGPGATSTSSLSFAQHHAHVPFSMAVAPEAAVYNIALSADITSTRVGALPARVDLTHHDEETRTSRIPVIAWFEGFFTRVTSILHAVWDPIVQTVSTYLSAWFGPITRTLSATLQATWGAITQTVGSWVSATVGSWLSTAVSTPVSAVLSAILSGTVTGWVSTTVGTWVSATIGAWVSGVIGGFYTTVSGWVNSIIGWITGEAWVPSRTASAYASTTASAYATGTAGAYASTTASSYAYRTVHGTASGTASGYAEGVGTAYASTQVTLPARTEQRTVSETVTLSGQTVGQIASGQVVVPGRTAEQHVSEDVWVEGRSVEQEVDVEYVIPAYTSAEVREQEPLVRHYRDQLSTFFALLTDDPYAPVPTTLGDGGPSQIEQYIHLLDEQAQGGGGQSGNGPSNPYKDALDQMQNNPHWAAHPDEAALLRSILYLAWLDSLSIPLDARVVMEAEAGGVAAERVYQMAELLGEGVHAQDVFRSLLGEELR